MAVYFRALAGDATSGPSPDVGVHVGPHKAV